MDRRKLLKIGLGSGFVAVMAAAGLAAASPTLAQSGAAPMAALTERGGRPGGIGRGGMQLSTIATALGMTEADLRTELQAGKSVADVASAKSVSLDTIVNAVVTAEQTRLQQAVTDGKLTQAQADTMLSNLKLTLPSQLQTKTVVGLSRRANGGLGFKSGAKLSAIATALGVTEADLRTELQAGKSVADVAAAKNVSLDTVINAIVDAETKTLAQAVTDGKLTQAQADQRIANLKANLPAQLAQKGWGGGGRGPGGSKQRTPNATPTAPGA